MLLNYKGLTNLYQYCAGVVPIGKVGKNEQIYQRRWRDRTSEILKVSMINSEGLSIGIYLDALLMKDELCLLLVGVMRIY